MWFPLHVPLLVEVNMLQECKLAFQEVSYGHLPMWEVRQNVLLARMPRNVLGFELPRSNWSISWKGSISRRRVRDPAAIFNCSKYTRQVIQEALFL